MLLEGKNPDFRNYAVAFLVFLVSVTISFFLGFRVGKNIAKEKLKQEISKVRESEIEEVVAGMTKYKEQSEKISDNLPSPSENHEEDEGGKDEARFSNQTTPQPSNPTSPQPKVLPSHPQQQSQKEDQNRSQFWSVQLASFRSREKADIFAKSVKIKYRISPHITQGDVNNKTIWRVRVGKFKEKKEAERFLSELKKKGISGQIAKY